MNDSQIRVFGQSAEQGSDELFKYICYLCDKVRSFKEAKQYCGHCDTLYCDECLKKDKHLGHKIVAVSDWGEERGDRCPACSRDGRKISQHCMDHGEYCCSQCAREKHSDCETISEIGQLARGVYASRDFESVNQEVVEKTNDTDKLTCSKTSARQALKASKTKSLDRLESLRTTVNEIFDKLVENASDEINENYDTDDYSLESDIEECEGVLANLRCLRMYLGSKNATELQMFLKLEPLRVKLKDFDRQLEGRESTLPKFEEYEFTEDPAVLEFVERIDTLKLRRRTQEPEPRLAERHTYSMRRTMTGKTVGRTSGTQHAETTSQHHFRTEEEPKLLQATNESHQPTKQGPPIERLKTAVNIEAPPEMDFDVRMSYCQNKSQLQTEKLQKEQAASKPTFVSDKSSGEAFCSEHGERSMPSTIGRATSAQSAQKSGSPPQGNDSNLYEELYNRTTREDTFSSQGKYKIRLPDDTQTCNIQGMFGLPNGNILLSDTKNKKLKVMNQSYKIIASCELNAGPRGVSEAGENQAVVALDNMKFQFVNIIDSYNLRPSKCVALRHDCYGISHHQGKLYVTEQDGKCVYVYDTAGKMVSTISGRDADGWFTCTQYVYITRDGTRIYVTDSMKGLVIVNSKNYALVATIAPSDITSACGVCTDKSGKVYVSGLRSQNVIQIGDRGKGMQRIVAKKESGVSYPISIWFNSFKAELIVSTNSNNQGDDFLTVQKVR